MNQPKPSKPNQAYRLLVNEIGEFLRQGKTQAVQTVNTILVEAYWRIGRHIVEYEQSGHEKATYGEALLDTLSKDLTLAYGRGFSRSNLFQMRSLYLAFPKIQTLSGQLSWSHYVELLKIDSELERSFYLKQCEQEKWSIRELKRQMRSMLFHRLALSKDKESILAMAQQGVDILKPVDIIKDPYILEFLEIPEQHQYQESDLEARLIQNLQSFLLELGKGFAYIGRQYRISIGGRHFYVDLIISEERRTLLEIKTRWALYLARIRTSY